MKINNNYISLLVFLFLLIITSGCNDSDIDAQFTPSSSNRIASFKLDVSTENINVGATLSSQTFAVTSTDDWLATSSEDWISFTSSSGSGNGNVSFTVQENTSDQTRTARITVTGVNSNQIRIVTVSQTGMSLSVDTEVIEFSYEGGTKTVEVITDGRFTMNNPVEWLTCETNDKILKVSAKPNPEIAGRETTITISLENSSLSRNIKVTQRGGFGITINDFGDDEVL